MAAILSRDFDAGTAGSSAAAEFDNTLGTAPVYHAPSAVTGPLGCRFVSTAGSSRGDFTFSAATTVWVSFYITVESAPAANVYIAEWRNGATKIGDIRMNSGATTLTMRDNNTAISGITTPALGVGQHRISIRITPGSATGHELRVYSGANLHGTSPDFSATGAATAAAQTQVTSVLLGIITSSTWSFGVDRLRLDNAVEPAGFVQLSTLTLQSVTASGWTATGGTPLEVLSDSDDATLLTSDGNPTNLVLGPLVLRPIETPAGDFVVTVRASRVDASSASLVGTLRDASNAIIASASAVNPGTSPSELAVTFTAASIAGVTQTQWRSGALRVQLAATATA